MLKNTLNYIKVCFHQNRIQLTFYIIAIFLLQSCTEIPDSKTHFSYTQIEVPKALPRVSAMGTVLNNELYILCGRNIAKKYLQDVWKYSPNTNQWTQLVDFPGVPRVKGTAIAFNGKIYAGLGYTNIHPNLSLDNYMKDFYSYNPKTGSWTKLHDFPNKYTNAAIAFCTANFIYVSIGFGQNEASEQTLRYDTEKDQWIKVGDYIRKTSNAVCYYGKRIFAGTGSPVNVNEWMEFNTQNESWEKRAEMPDKGRLSAICFGSDDYIYVGAGRHWGGDGSPRSSLNDLFEYDVLHNTWRKTGNLPGPSRESALAFSINGIFYIGFGENENTLNADFWKLTPQYEEEQ